MLFRSAPLIGIAKPVFKSHGSSDAKTFFNAIRNTYQYVKGDVVGQISSALASMNQEEAPEEGES